nr:hypothetical protein [Tanacetum cinerariifolium]
MSQSRQHDKSESVRCRFVVGVSGEDDGSGVRGSGVEQEVGKRSCRYWQETWVNRATFEVGGKETGYYLGCRFVVGVSGEDDGSGVRGSGVEQEVGKRSCRIGEMTFFLGLQVHKSPRDIIINQSNYVLEILKKHGMENYDPIGTPMKTKHKLDLDTNRTPGDAMKYQSMIARENNHVLEEMIITQKTNSLVVVKELEGSDDYTE